MFDLEVCLEDAETVLVLRVEGELQVDQQVVALVIGRFNIG